MNQQAQLELLLLRSKKENLLRNYCGEEFLNNVQESFRNILDFDVFRGCSPLEIKARKTIPDVSQFDFLEQRIKKTRMNLHNVLPENQKSYCREDGETDRDDFFDDQFRNKPKAPVLTFPGQHVAVVDEPSEDQA